MMWTPWNLILTVAFTATVVTARSARLITNKCPNIPSLKNLDLAKFSQGKWYRIAVAHTGTTPDYDCSSWQLITTNTEAVVVQNYFDERGVKQTFTQNHPVEILSTQTNGKSVFSSDPGGPLLMNTDYEHYALFYTCSAPVNQPIFESAIIFLRESELNNIDRMLNAVKGTLTKYGSKVPELLGRRISKTCPK